MNDQSGRWSLQWLLVRRECWTFTLCGKLTIALVLSVAAVTMARGLYPFLAITSRMAGDVLVVEGWIRENSIDQVVREINKENYQQVLVVKDVYSAGNKWESGRYMPEYIRENLVKQGVHEERIHLVFCDVLKKDRTYCSAIAVKNWLILHNMKVNSLDVLTIGAHARRSRLLFQKAFRSDVNIGVIAAEEREHDYNHWWRSSEGVREVLFEGFAYLYAKFFFIPS
jgi:hypothetical protein